jgi:hypothetical protein
MAERFILHSHLIDTDPGRRGALSQQVASSCAPASGLEFIKARARFFDRCREDRLEQKAFVPGPIRR